MYINGNNLNEEKKGGDTERKREQKCDVENRLLWTKDSEK